MIHRGDICLVNLGEVKTGTHVQKSMRPVLIISNDFNNCYSATVNIVPLTSKTKKKIPTHVSVNGYGLEKESIALVEQITTIDKSKINKLIGHIDNSALLNEIVGAIIKQAS